MVCGLVVWAIKSYLLEAVGREYGLAGKGLREETWPKGDPDVCDING